MKFRYQAKAGPGVIKNGFVEADNQLLVVTKLRQEGLFPLFVEQAGEKDSGRERRVASAEIAMFTRHLSDLLSAGFSLTTALVTLQAQARSSAMTRMIGDFREGIEKGQEFSAVLARFPASFSGFYVSMVRIGEAGGKLEESLGRLADFKEKEEEFQAQIKAALTYPAFLLLVGCSAVFVLSAFFIPKLAQMFSEFEQVLPVSTRIVMACGTFTARFWWVLLLLACCGVFAARAFWASERNRLVMDTFVLRIPFIERLARKIEAARFAYSLGILLKSGIPILEALRSAMLTVGNRRIRAQVATFAEQVRKGHSLSSCLRSGIRLFPEILCHMAAVGEESGELPAMLLRASKAFETEVNRDLKRVVSLMEPFLVLAIGGIMVAVVFSILLPIFQLDFLPK